MLVTLDSSIRKPLYVQIRDQLRDRILNGGLKVGDRLEASRELAHQLGVHRTTVGNAYAELESEGLIQGTVGRGTFVTPLAETLRAPRGRPRGASQDLFWESFFPEEPRDDSLGRLMASSGEEGVISFAAAHGAEELTSPDLVRRAADAVLRREGGRLVQYGSTGGYQPLKAYLQTRLRRDGIPVEFDEILVTHGCQQSLDLLRRALISPGETVVCENPTYTGLWNVFDSPGVRLMGVPVTPEGMDLDALEALLEQTRVKLIFCSPTFQNPTGFTMPLTARQRLLEIARRFQIPIVEDDVYGALRYRGRQIPPLKALDSAGLVIYLNSFSKVGFPGLRVGWLVASRPVIERLQWAKQRADLHTNLLGQAVVQELGARGWLDKWIRKTCKVYAHKQDVLRRAIERHFPPEVRVIYPDGGMSVWVELPAFLDAEELLVKARERRMTFAPARYFYFQNPKHNALRLCYTALPDDKIEKGTAILGDLLKAEMRRAKKGRPRTSVGASVALV
ncbi:MAG: PLP-dependent aminotransferase family protein [Terriglobia bacterium]|jgi:DNA-binding transcriptional MocR family regulator